MLHKPLKNHCWDKTLQLLKPNSLTATCCFCHFATSVVSLQGTEGPRGAPGVRGPPGVGLPGPKVHTCFSTFVHSSRVLNCGQHAKKKTKPSSGQNASTIYYQRCCWSVTCVSNHRENKVYQAKPAPRGREALESLEPRWLWQKEMWRKKCSRLPLLFWQVCCIALFPQGEPGTLGIPGLPGLPGEDGAPGQKVGQPSHILLPNSTGHWQPHTN